MYREYCLKKKKQISDLLHNFVKKMGPLHEGIPANGVIYLTTIAFIFGYSGGGVGVVVVVCGVI